jgi:hypothetical protein
VACILLLIGILETAGRRAKVALAKVNGATTQIAAHSTDDAEDDRKMDDRKMV